MGMATGTGKTSSFALHNAIQFLCGLPRLLMVVVVNVITIISGENVAAIMRRPWLIMRFWTSPGFLLTTRMPCGPTAVRKTPLVSAGAATF